MLIERLEREKHNLENRIKTLKISIVNPDSSRELEVLKIENIRLLEDLRNLNSKLEMQQHHSGALGAAMMQGKLESQERKIAILELAAKVSIVFKYIVLLVIICFLPLRICYKSTYQKTTT